MLVFALLGRAVTRLDWRAAAQRWWLGRGATMAFAAGMVLILAIGMLSLRNSNRLEELDQQATAADGFHHQVEAILSQVVDAQMHALAYLVTNAHKHLTAAALASAEASTTLQQWSQQQAEAAVFQKSLAQQVEALVGSQLKWQQQATQALRVGIPEADRTALVERGEQSLTELQLALKRIQTDFHQRVDQLKRDSTRQRRLGDAIVAGGTLVSLLIFVAALLRLNGVEGERRRSAQTLRASEARMRAVTESANDAIVTIDTRGAIVDWNPAAERLFGYPRSQAQGQALTMMMPQRYRQAHEAGLARRVADGALPLGGRAAVVHGLRQDGSEFPLELMVSHWEIEAGRFYTGVMRDITERKDSEAALKAAEQRFRDIVDATDGIVWEADATTFDFTYVSQKAQRLLGYPLEDWYQVGFWVAHLHPDDKDWAPAYCVSCTGKREPHDFEYRFIASDGRVVWLHDIVTVVTENEQPRWLRGLMVDITARKAMEQELQKLAQAVEQSPESIVITNARAEIEYVNEAFIRATGYTRDEVIGRNPRLLHSGHTPSETYTALWTALRAGQAWKGEFHNRRKDGTEYVEVALVSPIHQPDGSITHYLAVKEDVTEKKRQSAELDQHRNHLETLVQSRTAEMHAAQRRAEEANAAKSTFLANMSHEIRTPMNAILGLAHLLRMDAAPAQAERLDKISDAGRHLMSIINDILDLSKIEAGKLQLEDRDFALGAVLDHVRSMILAAAEAKGLAVEVDTSAVPMWLRGDPTRLRQALLNYAANAVKFTESGTIWLRAMLLQEDEGGLRLRFEAEDTGIGIAPEHLPRLFQAFEQGDASTTRKYGGTGLGLAITRRLAQLMQGDVGVDSTAGVGSTFWFTARLQRGQAGVSSPPPSTPIARAEAQLRAQHAGARLLLAEDNEINREVALQMLLRVGLMVDTAVDGRQAVDRARAQPYDLILMDMQMPRMDGLEATRAIRALPGYEKTPIVALTANAFDEDRRASEVAGMNDYIVKPIDMEQLFATLLKWLPQPNPQVRSATSQPWRAIDPSDPAATLGETDIAVLDAARGMVALQGDSAAYIGLLRYFSAIHADLVAALRAELGASRIEPVRQKVHALKGTASVLAATGVRAAAAALETALRAGAPAATWPALLDALKDALDALQQVLQPWSLAEGDGTAAFDPAGAAEVLARIEPLLAAHDAAAGELLRAQRPRLLASLGAAALALERQIAQSDFVAALTTVQRLRASRYLERR